MVEYIGSSLVDIDPGFDVLRYLTVRTLGGTITALLITGLVSSCVKEYIDAVDGGFSADARFQPEYGARLAYANLSLDDFFNNKVTIFC